MVLRNRDGGIPGQSGKASQARQVELDEADDSDQLSFADAIGNIRHLSHPGDDRSEEQRQESVSEQLGIKDSEYVIPVEPFDTPHFIAVIACIGIPSMMFVGSFLADGARAFLNPRMLLLIPVIVLFWLVVKWTDGLGSVDVEDIERTYPDIIVIDGNDESDDPKRPVKLNIRTKDDSTASFTMVTRQDWESNLASRRRQGVLVVKNGKAAVMVEDVSPDAMAD